VAVVVVVVAVVAVAVVVFLEVAVITVVIMIPFVAVLETSMITVPIAGVVVTALVTRSNPARAGVGRPRPVTLMPAVMTALGIPVTTDPDEFRPGLFGKHGDDARRRRRTDADTDRYLSASHLRTSEQNSEKQSGSD
jgi:hypothetical protein